MSRKSKRRAAAAARARATAGPKAKGAKAASGSPGAKRSAVAVRGHQRGKEPLREQRSWFRRLTNTIVVTAAAGVLAFVVLRHATVDPDRSASGQQGRMRSLPVGYDLAMSSLDRWKSTWFPPEKDALVASMQVRRDALEPALRWIAARRRHPQHEDAIALLTALDKTAPPIVDDPDQPPALMLGAGGELQGRGLDTGEEKGAETVDEGVADEGEKVADAGRPSGEAVEVDPAKEPAPKVDPLIAALAATEVEAKLAALTAIGSAGCTTEELQLAVIEEFDAEDEAVRDAAAALLSSDLGEVVRRELIDRLGLRGEHRCVVRVLARQNWDAEGLTKLVEALRPFVRAAEAATIEELGAIGAEASLTPDLWHAALDKDAPADGRLAAIRVLDGLGSNSAQLPGELGDLPPRMRYYAARLLCRDHRRDVLPLLVALAETYPEDDPDLALAVKILLASLAGLPPHESFDLIKAAVLAPDFEFRNELPPPARL